MALSQLRRIPPVPAALAVGLVNLIIGLIVGILGAISTYAAQASGLISLLADYAGISGITVPVFSGMAAALWIIAYPISGFVMGFLGTLILVAVYNLVAKKVPIRLELK